MANNFISDFLAYGSGTECPKNFIRWASLTPLAIAMGRRYFTKVGIFIYHPELCFVLVAQSGAKKSVAKDFAKQVVQEAMPNQPIAADITSRDGLINWLASDSTLRHYVNFEGAECEWHPLALFVDEMVHFTSYSVHDMINLLVAIYGQKFFQSITIKRKTENIIEPCVNLVGCCTTEWITDNLKRGNLKGGWSRRFHVIYEPKLSEEVIPWPMGASGREVYLKRMCDHLHYIEANAGEFVWTEKAKHYHDIWYRQNHSTLPDDPNLRAYFLTKGVHLAKIAMLVAAAHEKFELKITDDILDETLAIFTTTEINLPDLYLSGGRNELIIPQMQAMKLLDKYGGGMFKKRWMIEMQKDLDPMEQLNIMRYLKESGQIYEANVEKEGVVIPMLLTPKKMIEVQKNGGKWC